MVLDVDCFFLAKDLEASCDRAAPSEPWRVRAIKQLWLDQPDFDFCEVIRHPAFAAHAAELAAWHRLFQKYLAAYNKKAAADFPRLMKQAPHGDIRLPRDPWLQARTSAWYADTVRGLRQEVIDGGYWFRMERSPLDDD